MFELFLQTEDSEGTKIDVKSGVNILFIFHYNISICEYIMAVVKMVRLV